MIINIIAVSLFFTIMCGTFIWWRREIRLHKRKKLIIITLEQILFDLRGINAEVDKALQTKE